MSTTASAENNSAIGQSSPGVILREKREKLEINIEEIAKNIHLEKKIIEAIEADDYENLPAAIYVRGYLRSYAKIVNVDAEQIISLYNSDTPHTEPEILPEVKPPSQASSSDKPVKAFTYLISLGLVLLLLIWYQSNFVVDTNRVEKENAGMTTPDFINGVDSTYKVITHVDGWQTPNNIDVEEFIENEPIDALNIDDNEAPTDLLSIENAASEQIGTIGQDRLVLNLKNDSWIEVYGANDERLFHDLGRAGEEYIINGTTPFDITLGFSEGVLVKFNGEVFDQTPYSENGVARFSISKE